ncbi:MAG: bifunctional DNA-formamidopyrimidine glycosylase/DNA-(apurinic or apyrimidinic site) lyase [Labilithrix sp.]|nr:bifunctional DNA-formamidopyrimidine glycosylase/DNA-(apurinic or apyrimidinic site) lyase [Labilithrix sp.]MCW5831436.1 bifunctional DNA-formamidopyrimidine glycosylase/DNA-(apurinic or apyrimidinic site) lyase [Labilithrix sp.]
MPELPEVEHTRRNLERWTRGARIVAVATTDARIVRPLRPRAFVSRLEGRTVRAVDRRGKWLRLALDGAAGLFVHLGMTGWFERADVGGPRNPLLSARGDRASPMRFERVRFELERRARPSVVVYVDPRRWGRMVLSDADIAPWTTLGPDPLSDGIDVDALSAALARRAKRSIKEVLMDQRVLAGIGNIQATEALWKARVDPRSRAGSLDRARVVELARAVRWTIRRTLADLAKGDRGADDPFVAYGRDGEPCPRCGARFTKVALGGRTTTFCPRCQARTA